jgi:hypothetical protein
VSGEQVGKRRERLRCHALLAPIRQNGVGQLFDHYLERGRLDRHALDLAIRRDVARVPEGVVPDHDEASARSVLAAEDLNEIEVDGRDDDAHVRSVAGDSAEGKRLDERRLVRGGVGRNGRFDACASELVGFDREKGCVQGNGGHRNGRSVIVQGVQPRSPRVCGQRLVRDGGCDCRIGIRRERTCASVSSGSTGIWRAR